MGLRAAVPALLAAVMVIGTARAEDEDLASGEKLYVAQCKICHGNVSPQQTSDHVPLPSQWRSVHVAMQQPARSAMGDVFGPIPSGFNASAATGASYGEDATGGRGIAVAPPYGPPLRGIHGRPAGTVKGYIYSSAFLKSLHGMEWNDAALDVWITDTQAWIPGVYMFYKQRNPEVRRKIILYLKANP